MQLLWLLLIALGLVCLAAALAVIHRLRHPPRKTFAVALARHEPTEPQDLGLRGEAVTFTLSHGDASPGWIIAGHQHAGPTVVIVHGFGDSRYGALTWVPLFTPHASRIVVFDLPGHGDSQRATSQAGLGEAADVLAVLEQLPSSRPVVLFGYSLGAGIAVVAAAQAATGASGGSGGDTPRLATSGGPIIGVIADGLYRRWDEPIKQYLWSRRYPPQPIAFLAGVLLRLSGVRLGRFDRVQYARRLRCPLLAFHGGRDELCPPNAAREVVEAAPQGRLVLFPGAYHLELVADDRPRYTAELAAFFESLHLPQRHRDAEEKTGN